MRLMTAGLLAVALSLGLSPCHAGQQEEIDAMKQEVAGLTERVWHLEEVDRRTRDVLEIQVKLNAVQAEINALIREKLLQQ